jgi:hypothetical protein
MKSKALVQLCLSHVFDADRARGSDKAAIEGNHGFAVNGPREVQSIGKV